MKSIIILLIILAVLIGGSYFLFGRDSRESSSDNPKNTEPIESVKNMKAKIKTNLGDVEIELFSSKTPKTVENFITLAKAGFYNNTKFHRVIENFMIQGGDPLSADDSKKAFWGTGGPGYKFNDEISAENRNAKGTIAMANSGPNTNGSQFFINTADNDFLNAKHTVFGQVVRGMEAVKAIEKTATDENDCPLEAVIVQAIEITEE